MRRGMLLIWIFCIASGGTNSFAADAKSGNEERGLFALDFDFDDPPETRNKITDNLRYGVELTFETDWDKNHDLASSVNDDRLAVEPQIEVAVSYDASEDSLFFLDLELTKVWFLDERRRPRRPQTELHLKELYWLLKNAFEGGTLQFGRQKFEDARRWLFDEELDAIRLFHRFGRYGYQISVSREKLVDENLLGQDDNDPINNYLLMGRYAVDEDSELTAYIMFRDDLTARRDDPLFLGIRSIGRPISRFKYWVDAAYLLGNNGSQDLQAYAIDAGASYRFRGAVRPTLGVGVAFGSGDSNPNDSKDHNFRQTGLHRNTGKFNGVTSFEYYGATLDPELSNMLILTGDVGIRPTRRSSIDLVYHYYRQHQPSTVLRDTSLRPSPQGTNGDLGHGIDLVFGVREFKDVKMEAVFGMFIPGKAFADGVDNAYFIGTEFSFRF